MHFLERDERGILKQERKEIERRRTNALKKSKSELKLQLFGK